MLIGQNNNVLSSNNAGHHNYLFGYNLTLSSTSQAESVTLGVYNKYDEEYTFAIGNGSSSSRHNVVEIGTDAMKIDLDHSLTNTSLTMAMGELLIGASNITYKASSQRITTIKASTTSATLAEGVYEHTPTSAPTYKLPLVYDTTRTHEVVVNVKFTNNISTYTFTDYNGTVITPLSTPTISNGSVIAFLCSYNGLLGSWVVMPVEMGVTA